MFKILKNSKWSKLRIGEIITSHGKVETPVFIPPATYGALKATGVDDLEKIRAEIILVNALHLHFKPGDKFIKEFGGIHKFMNWYKP
ncbi:MAG: tRNA-guanine transglycosylase, partial [candidate division WOR-3 bacterium]|nr:tRNA-guanine transglycosylase [candidate division WOR-3 bacterium]